MSDANITTPLIGDTSLTVVMAFSNERLSSGSLTNAIHPVFARKNFDASINYDILIPALRLASRFLEMEDVLPFWHTLLFGHKKGSVQCGQQSHQKQVPTCLLAKGYRGRFTSQQADKAKRALRELSHNVTFTALSKVHGNFSKANGYTEGTNHPATGGFRGCKSIVELDLHGLEEACSNAMESRRSVQWLAICLQLALLLYHELCHVGVNASQGPRCVAEDCNNGPCRHGDLILDGCCTSEEGFEGVSRLFGGDVDLLNNQMFPDQASPLGSLGGRVCVFEWPSATTVSLYEKTQDETAVREGTMLSDRLFMMEYSFVENLFSDAFWKDEVSKKGVGALQAFRKTFYRYDHVSATMTGPFQDPDVRKELPKSASPLTIWSRIVDVVGR